MSVVATAAVGEVGEGTILRFTQEGAVISAHYAGGTIRVGYLAGVRDGANVTFRYTQVDESGRVDGGRSQCELSTLEDGRLRLVEHFQWESREGSGTNVFEEIA
jgi:hypothetical protein